MKRPRQAAVLFSTALFLAAITALGQLSGLKLLLFPELGALASVVFRDPASPWARSPRLLLLTPLLAAVAGILVSRHLSYGPAAVSLVLAVALLPLVLPQPPLVFPLLVLVGGGWLVVVARMTAAGIFRPCRWWSGSESRAAHSSDP